MQNNVNRNLFCNFACEINILRRRNDGEDSNEMPTRNGEHKVEELVNPRHGYVIDCTKRTLTC